MSSRGACAEVLCLREEGRALVGGLADKPTWRASAARIQKAEFCRMAVLTLGRNLSLSSERNTELGHPHTLVRPLHLGRRGRHRTGLALC